jgi:hypothetical protein
VGRDGAFTLSNVAPGQYKLFAWVTSEGRLYYNEQFLVPYDSLGTVVTVTKTAEWRAFNWT